MPLENPFADPVIDPAETPDPPDGGDTGNPSNFKEKFEKAKDSLEKFGGKIIDTAEDALDFAVDVADFVNEKYEGVKDLHHHINHETKLGRFVEGYMGSSMPPHEEIDNLLGKFRDETRRRTKTPIGAWIENRKLRKSGVDVEKNPPGEFEHAMAQELVQHALLEAFPELQADPNEKFNLSHLSLEKKQLTIPKKFGRFTKERSEEPEVYFEDIEGHEGEIGRFVFRLNNNRWGDKATVITALVKIDSEGHPKFDSKYLEGDSIFHIMTENEYNRAMKEPKDKTEDDNPRRDAMVGKLTIEEYTDKLKAREEKYTRVEVAYAEKLMTELAAKHEVLENLRDRVTESLGEETGKVIYKVLGVDKENATRVEANTNEVMSLVMSMAESHPDFDSLLPAVQSIAAAYGLSMEAAEDIFAKAKAERAPPDEKAEAWLRENDEIIVQAVMDHVGDEEGFEKAMYKLIDDSGLGTSAAVVAANELGNSDLYQENDSFRVEAQDWFRNNDPVLRALASANADDPEGFKEEVLIRARDENLDDITALTVVIMAKKKYYS